MSNYVRFCFCFHKLMDLIHKVKKKLKICILIFIEILLLSAWAPFPNISRGKKGGWRAVESKKVIVESYDAKSKITNPGEKTPPGRCVYYLFLFIYLQCRTGLPHLQNKLWTNNINI